MDDDARLLPLERFLKDKSSSDPHSFPLRDVKYFEQYLNIKSWLTENHFRDAGAGLSTDGNRYTQHDLGHVNDVIGIAGSMLRVKEDQNLLSGFEAYVLLVSILLHDSGNAEGREKHEQKAAKIIAEMGDVAGTATQEKRLIAKIAQAHGGNVQYNNITTKDTIATLLDSTYYNFTNDVVARPRLVAAILRLSDELAENPTRANSRAVKDVKNQDITEYKSDVIHNLFCHIIQVTLHPESHTISLSFDIDKRLVTQLFKIEEKNENGNSAIPDIYLIDYIIERIKKTDRERRYCNRFLMGLIHFDTITAALEITNEYETVELIEFRIEERGFPECGIGSDICDIAGNYPKINGQVLFEKYSSETETKTAEDNT